MVQRLDSEIGRWRVDGHPLTIEYSHAVMDRIRSAVLDGFYRIVRGGVEVGGVLFGVREGSSVRILAFRTLSCQYASGPVFVLSEKDERALRQLLEAAATESELEGMVPVGWFHSHTRSGIFLSDKDLEIYNRYFPEPWQIALVIHPEKLKPVRAGFFLREKDKSIRAESSYREFLLEPRRRPGNSVPPQAVAKEKELPELQLVARPQRVVPDASRRWVDWTLFAISVCLMLGGAALFSWSLWFQGSAGRLSLTVLDIAGQLEIRWDPSLRAVRQADAGVLDITDGNKTVRLEMSPEQLRNGSLTYVRESASVLLRLQVNRAGMKRASAETRYIGLPITQEVERLRSELEEEAARNSRLEAEIKALRSRASTAQGLR